MREVAEWHEDVISILTTQDFYFNAKVLFPNIRTTGYRNTDMINLTVCPVSEQIDMEGPLF